MRFFPLSFLLLAIPIEFILPAMGYDRSPGFLHLDSPRGLYEFRSELDHFYQTSGHSKSERREQFFQERFRGDVAGDIYDERFLNFNVGAGFTVSQDKVSGAGERFTEPFDGEYGGRINLLPKHAMGGAMSFDKNTLTPHNVFSGKARIERTNITGSLSLRKGRVPMTLGYRRSNLDGGFGVDIRQRAEGLHWQASTSLGESFSARFDQESEWFASLINPDYEQHQSDMSLNGKIQNGHQWQLRSHYRKRRGALPFEQLRGEGRWTTTWKPFRIRLASGYERRKDDLQDSGHQTARLQIHHQLYESLSSQIQMGEDRIREGSEQEKTYTAQIDEDYIKTLHRHLRLNLHYAGYFEQSKAEFQSLLGTVTDEPHDLRDGQVTFLNNLSVDPRSVLVTSLGGIRQYTEGVDYEVIAKGPLLQIRRILTGNIVNGERVLVDYRYQVFGTRRTKATRHRGRLALLLGQTGNLYTEVAKERQRLSDTAPGPVVLNQESFKETIYGIDFNWKYFSAHQMWKNKRSDIVPLNAFESRLRAGGSITEKLRLVIGWSYNRTLLTESHSRSFNRTTFANWGYRFRPRLRLSGQLLRGKTSTAGTPGRFHLTFLKVQWNYRSFDLEVSDRYTKRWLSDTFEEENFFQSKILRTF